MSGNPSNSAASSSAAKRPKAMPEKKSKMSKKSDAEAGPSSSIMSRMMGSGNATDKSYTLEEKANLGVHYILNEMKIKADDASIEMLANLAQTLCSNILTEARAVSIHAERTDILPEDVNYAAKKYMVKQQSRIEKAELAKAINSQEIPKIRGSGLYLPVDRYCITQPTFQTSVAFKIQENTEEQAQPSSSTQRKEGMGSMQVTSMLKPQDDAYD